MKIKSHFKSNFIANLLLIFLGSSSLFAITTATANPSKDSDKSFDPETWKPKAIPKISNEERKKICQQYKGQYISSIGTQVYFVENDCKRRKLDLSDTQEATKNQKSVFKLVEAKVIAALPLAKKQAKYTKEDVLKKYKNLCISAGKEVYLVTDDGKKIFPDRAIANQYCLKKEKDEIKQVEYAELTLLKDLEPFKIQGDIYRKREMPILDIQKPSEVCKKLKAGATYSFHSRIFELVKDKEECYFQELNRFEQDTRSKLGDNPPIEVERSDFASISNKPFKTQTDH